MQGISQKGPLASQLCSEAQVFAQGPGTQVVPSLEVSDSSGGALSSAGEEWT